MPQLLLSHTHSLIYLSLIFKLQNGGLFRPGDLSLRGHQHSYHGIECRQRWHHNNRTYLEGWPEWWDIGEHRDRIGCNLQYDHDKWKRVVICLRKFSKFLCWYKRTWFEMLHLYLLVETSNDSILLVFLRKAGLKNVFKGT